MMHEFLKGCYKSVSYKIHHSYIFIKLIIHIYVIVIRKNQEMYI